MKSKFPLVDLFDCAQREVGYRKRCYPRWIRDGKIEAARAAREIELMETIAALLKETLMNNRQVPIFRDDLPES